MNISVKPKYHPGRYIGQSLIVKLCSENSVILQTLSYIKVCYLVCTKLRNIYEKVHYMLSN